jgi:hypothetical protein
LARRLTALPALSLVGNDEPSIIDAARNPGRRAQAVPAAIRGSLDPEVRFARN